MRVAFDTQGCVGARRIDATDGRSMSEFKGRLGESFRVSRDKASITVLKKDADNWVTVKVHDECASILKREREVFTPPNFALRLPL